MQNDSLLNRSEAAAVLKISLRTFDDRVAKGEIMAVRIGRAIRFRRRSLDDFIESNETRLNAKRRAAIQGRK